MKRFLVLTLIAAAAAGAVWLAVPHAQQARAVDATQVIGAYKLKLKGDGWLRGAQRPYVTERVSGLATLLLSRNVPDDGKLHCEVRLSSKFTNGVLDLATPEPAFVGDGFIVGDSITLIDAGRPTYVNAMTLTFAKDGAKVAGHWLASFPATDAATSPASAVGVGVTGRRVALRELSHGHSR
jgi:hypothetical protein